MRDQNINCCYFFECAITTSRQLFLLGWIDDRDSPLTRVVVEGLDGKRRRYAINETDADGTCLRTPRPDVHKSLRLPSHVSSRLGFVIALPEQLADGEQVIVSFDGYEQAAQLLEAVPVRGAPSALAGLLIHSGYALRELALELHAERMIQWIDGASNARRSASRALVVVDSALAIAGE
jgi:hypothetical protein